MKFKFIFKNIRHSGEISCTFNLFFVGQI